MSKHGKYGVHHHYSAHGNSHREEIRIVYELVDMFEVHPQFDNREDTKLRVEMLNKKVEQMREEDWEITVTEGGMSVRQKSSGHVARYYRPGEPMKNMPYQNHTENQTAARGVGEFLPEAQKRADQKGRELGWLA